MRPEPISNPPDPFTHRALEYLEEVPVARPSVYEDRTKEILSRNDSPDLGFTFSVNPYRGCGHACAYCYARPTHEYLGFGAGSDFDTRIAVKRNAPELLEAAFERRSWRGETVVFSGVTDPYQPLEATWQLTRRCLEVCARYRNPVGIITKSALIERDLDVLSTLAKTARLRVTVSIPFWNEARARAIEPGVATPKRRMRIIRTLAEADISVGVNVAPVIPGLDEEVGEILRHAREAGATHAGWVLLRLPGSVKQVFEQRLREALPLAADKVLNRIREMNGGMLYDPRFGKRGRGTGVQARALEALFETTCRKLGLSRGLPGDEGPSPFVRPAKPKAQLELFPEKGPDGG